MERSLNAMNAGETGRITRLCVAPKLRRRLLDLGMTEGTEISCLRKSLWGDPVIYKVRGSMIALRKIDSSQVFVEALA